MITRAWGKVKNIYEAAIGSTFFQSAAILVSGTAVAQIIKLAASPILTRLYDPGAFGLLGLFAAAASIIGVVSAWKYELAIVLPESDVEAVSVFTLASLLVGGTTILTFVGVILGADLIASLMEPFACGVSRVAAARCDNDRDVSCAELLVHAANSLYAPFDLSKHSVCGNRWDANGFWGCGCGCDRAHRRTSGWRVCCGPLVTWSDLAR